MGSIADLLGDQLPPEWQPDGAQQAQSGSAEQPEDEAQRGPRAVAVSAILTEVRLDPADMRPDLRLDEDLELTGLPLWSVVAQIERELKTTFADSAVRSWKTVEDVLRSAEQS